jgi:hypothetical protein
MRICVVQCAKCSIIISIWAITTILPYAIKAEAELSVVHKPVTPEGWVTELAVTTW